MFLNFGHNFVKVVDSNFSNPNASFPVCQPLLLNSTADRCIPPFIMHKLRSRFLIWLFFISLLCTLFSLAVAASTSFAETVTLAWDANIEPDVKGYNIYCGTASGSYSQSIDAGNNTQATITGLQAGVTYYIAATSYTEINESEFSAEVSYTVPAQDTDGNGVGDDENASPSDPNESLDTDGDGVGNNTDTDDDADGMPDTWELSYGLDPLINDAADDPDEDGISNIDEYRLGTRPDFYEGNYEPEPPSLLTPSEHEVVPLTPLLSTGEFYDRNVNDIHSRTQWEIVRSIDGLRVFDVTTESSLTRLTVPRMILDEDTDYIWRVKFFDQLGTPSEWSEDGYFTTDFMEQDSDGNGILDHQEADHSLDIDGDGIPDEDQDDIKCVKVEGKTTQLGLSIKDSETVQSIASIESETLEETQNISRFIAESDDLPYGLINYKLILTNPGAEVEVTLYLSQPAPADGKWYKYDPINETWQDYSEFATVSEDRKSVILYLADGGIGDADGIENGIIVDPLALSVPASTSTPGPGAGAAGGVSGSGSGSGCFIASTADDLNSNEMLDLIYKLGIGLAAVSLLIKRLLRNMLSTPE